MTTETRNEAAERLLREVEGFQGQYGAFATASGFSYHDAPALLDEALATERRATVQRIRSALEEKTYAAWDGISDAPAVVFEDVATILDEEAARS